MANIQTYENDKQPIFTDADGLPYYGQIVNIDDWQVVLSNYQQLKIQLAPHKILLILDDVHQCEYTSMHASMGDELYADTSIKGFNFDTLEEGVDFDDPVQVHELRTQYLVKALQNQDNSHSDEIISNIIEKTSHYEEDDFEALLMINKNPLALLDNTDSDKHKVILCMGENIPTESLKIAMKPNGYFSCDFNTFENYYIVSRLTKLGFEFMGLGASLLGFIKKNTFTDEYTAEISNLLAKIYHLDEATQQQFHHHIASNNYLILYYSEDPCELV